MYKLGMAGILVVIEFLIARFTGLDMGRFMKWHYSNVDDVRFTVANRYKFFIFFLEKNRNTQIHLL
jgi:hypothetical protein